MFFQTQLDQTVHMLVKSVSNKCSAKTYYINRPTLKNRKSVATSFRTEELTNELRFCSHMMVAVIAVVSITLPAVNGDQRAN
jgi:hypothetical protein